MKKIISLSIIILLGINIYSCASGSAIVTGTVRSPIDPKQVKLYLETPEKYEVIGLVNASSDSGLTEQGDMDYAVAELKKQAAKIGANGILLISSGDSTTGAVSYGYGYTAAVKAKTLQGKAIFVENK